MYDIVIIGGGLGGLISSILLKKQGHQVLLLEKNKYPFHRVCGEYISNEVVPFLEEQDLYPADLAPSNIHKLIISSTRGSYFTANLDLGGFGISRYTYDLWLANKAKALGVELKEQTTVTNITKCDDYWEIQTNDNTTYTSSLVIGAHGKRTKLDQRLNRQFLNETSPYMGVKYHVKADFAQDTIALHNFKGGYCGFSKVDNGLYNVCYLTHRDQVKKHGSIPDFEKKVVHRNPHLRDIWSNAEFVFDKPMVINEISFKPKEPVYNGILMIGDSAGMITPLAGNGMAMAIRSAVMLSSIIGKHHTNNQSNSSAIAQEYTERWNNYFRPKLWMGRQIQKVFFGNSMASTSAVITGKLFKNITQMVIKQTHGEPFSTQ